MMSNLFLPAHGVCALGASSKDSQEAETQITDEAVAQALSSVFAIEELSPEVSLALIGAPPSRTLPLPLSCFSPLPLPCPMPPSPPDPQCMLSHVLCAGRF